LSVNISSMAASLTVMNSVYASRSRLTAAAIFSALPSLRARVTSPFAAM
jgi:hypothetical protein